MRCFHEFRINRFFEHGKQGGIVAVGVEHDDHSVEQAELLPCDDFQQFLHCAASAGQCDDGIGKRCHLSFARMDVGRDNDLRKPGMSPALVGHELGDYADYGAIRFEHAVGKLAHQAFVSCATHRFNPVAGQQCAEHGGVGKIFFVDIGA